MSAPPSIETEPWERVAEWTETAFDAPFVTVETHNAVYERPEFREQVASLIPEHIDQSPRAVFTAGLSLEPSIPGEETPARLLDLASKYASREFQASLSEDGLEGVERTGSKDVRLRGRRTAKAFQFDADYPLDGNSGTDGQPRLQVRVWAALWPTEESFAMAGGIYPLEDLSSALRRVGGRTDVSIEAMPGGDRRVVFDRIREAAE